VVIPRACSPKGLYLAGFGPDVVDRARGWQGRSGWSRDRDDAIRFLSRGGSGSLLPRGTLRRLLRPDGTADRPSCVYRIAVGYEPPAVARNRGHQGLPEQLDLDGAI
jgi:hypothetical protein